MTYLLGIDLGTTFTAAAVCRREGGAWGQAEVVPLGSRTAAIASVLFCDDTGGLLVGEAAERRVVTDPTRVVREVKRRIGDSVPVLVGGEPWRAQDLVARLARWVVDTVSAREGGAPELVAITHPAGWGTHRTSLLATALREAGVADAVLLTEPHAAAVCYASTERMATGATIAVYDLGGGTFDACVLRKSGLDAFVPLGRPVGHDRLGGLDFDEQILGHLRDCWPDAFDRVDPADPAQLAALSRLKRECAEAKEALSVDTEVVIPVLLPHFQAQARLVRAEFEAMIEPAVRETVHLLESAVHEAGIAPAGLSAVLLVGGSARIPLVTELLSAALDRPVAVDTDPKAAVALGAALALRSVANADLIPAPAADPAGPTVPFVPRARPPRPEETLDRLTPVQRPRRRLTGKALAVIGGLAVAAVLAGTITGLPDQLTGASTPAHAATNTGVAGQSAVAAGQAGPAGTRPGGKPGATGSVPAGTGAAGAPQAGGAAPANPTSGPTAKAAPSAPAGSAPTSMRNSPQSGMVTPPSSPPSSESSAPPVSDSPTAPPST
ncbi:MAG TPA: Hsp70 family protein [Pseudonocardiaceae bacterium]|jgi:actin-like ATPase involved in cell morphogenesis|nr:Hsp70 family protein [Pseudonocardiaceae bacterium]